MLRVSERTWWAVALGLGAIAFAFLLWLGHAEESLPQPALRPAHARPLPTAAPAEADDAPADDPAPAPVHDANQLPDQLTRRDLDAAMAKVASRVARCHEGGFQAAVVRVRLVIRRSGQTQSAVALGPDSQTPVGKCVAHAAASAVFPRFSGTSSPTVELVYPFYVTPAVPRQVGNPLPAAH